MTLNILFLTITIKKRKVSAEEYWNNELARKVEEENKYLIASQFRMF